MAAKAHLQAALGLDSKQWKAGMKDAQGSTNSFQKSIKGVGAAIGAAFSVAAVTRMAKGLINWASDISIAARNVGILTSEMLALNEIAVQSNIGTRDFQTLLSRLSEEIFAAARGATELKQVYADLGLSIEDLAGLGPVEQMQKIGKAALESANPTGALAKIFGQRLGPNARVALEAVVAGMTNIDRKVGEQADNLEALGSKWARYGEVIKRWSLSATVSVGKVHDRWTDLLGAAGAELFSAEGNFFGRTFKRFMDMGQSGKENEAAEKARRDALREQQLKDEKALAQKTAEAKRDEARKADEKAAADVRDQIEDRRIKQMEGLQRMEAEYQRFVDSITDKMESAGDHEKKALRDLLDYERGIHKDRVDAFRQAEKEKSAEAKRSADRQIESIIKPLEAERDRLREEMQSVASRTQGAGLMVSGLSRVGGSMGGERPGLMLVDKQLKVAYEQARIQGEIRDTERQILIAVQKGDNDGGGSAGDIF